MNNVKTKLETLAEQRDRAKIYKDNWDEATEKAKKEVEDAERKVEELKKALEKAINGADKIKSKFVLMRAENEEADKNFKKMDDKYAEEKRKTDLDAEFEIDYEQSPLSILTNLREQKK
jgi:hypothetical protein